MISQLQFRSLHVNIEDVLDVVDAALASVARRLPAHVSRDDLLGAGRLALVRAAAEFTGDIENLRGFCFVRVRGAILDELRRQDPLSRRVRRRVNAIRRVAIQLEQTLGRVPTDAELGDAVMLPADVVRSTLDAALAAQCADETTVAEVADVTTPAASARAEATELATIVDAALARLPVREAEVLRRYHFEGATLQDIAFTLGVSIARAHQLRSAGEKRLREDLTVLALWHAHFGG
ncbi:MAG TPA: sigma-70 family RNA polymerase sigma factor [Opitutaceae bacterium]